MSPAPRRKSSWVFYLVVGLILGAIPVAYFVFLGSPPPVAPPPPPAAAAKPQELKIGEVTGTVQIRKPGGEWVTAAKGAPLSASDSVRTTDGSIAVLVAGEAYEVKLEAGTEVSVDALTDSISRILLSSGMATARVKAGSKHTFEVKAAGSDAVARTQNGTFAISTNGQGTVAVGTQEGEVEFLGKGKMVIVRAGQQSIVTPGHGPSDPAPVPNSLLLKVQWPSASELNRRKLLVAGTAEPGSRVEVMGKVVYVDASGKFSQSVELAEGKNAVHVVGHSVGGLSREEKKDVVVDTTPPRATVDLPWVKKK